MVRLFSNANYKFIEIRRIAYLATAVALAVCLGFAIFWQVTRGHWLNYNVDFTGGTMIQVKFNQPTTSAEVRHAVEGSVPGTEISEFGGENEFLLRAPQFAAGEETAVDRIRAALKSMNRPHTLVRTEAVGPKVGSELQRKAATALILSFAATLIYLAFRFEWRFGLAAIIATAHDTILTLGFISIFQFEVSLTTVAAILTVVGYSLHDTIVIFDRIRENLKKGGKRIELVEMMNRSINETLPRTILTVLTTLATLASLAMFGGQVIRGFATIMFFGIMLGAYSSIFVATPILYEIEKRWGAKDKKARVIKPARASAAV
jgi:preprotein translocase subunit SecF